MIIGKDKKNPHFHHLDESGDRQHHYLSLLV